MTTETKEIVETGTTPRSMTVRLDKSGRYDLVVTGGAVTELATVGTVAVEEPIDDGVGPDPKPKDGDPPESGTDR